MFSIFFGAIIDCYKNCKIVIDDDVYIHTNSLAFYLFLQYLILLNKRDNILLYSLLIL